MNHLTAEVKHYGYFQKDNQLRWPEKSNRCIISGFRDEIQGVAKLIYTL
jgi:hypothetical protein